MFFTKARKIISFIITILLCLSTLLISYSCNKNNPKAEPEPICKVSFTVNGETTTIFSCAKVFCNYQYSTQYFTECKKFYLPFAVAGTESKKHFGDNFIVLYLSKESKTIDLADKEDFLVNCHFIYPDNNHYYFKCKYSGKIEYQYVYVDIIDVRTITITTVGGKTTFNVDNYNITYFNS